MVEIWRLSGKFEANNSRVTSEFGARNDFDLENELRVSGYSGEAYQLPSGSSLRSRSAAAKRI